MGRFIRTALNPEHEASAIGDAVLPFLFAGDRRDHLDREIIPALQRGAVITDRYYHSSLAPVAGWVYRPWPPQRALSRSDITIFLDLEPEIGLARIEARGETERFEALDKLRQIGNTTVVHCRARSENIVRINADASVEEVHAEVIAAVEGVLA